MMYRWLRGESCFQAPEKIDGLYCTGTGTGKGGVIGRRRMEKCGLVLNKVYCCATKDTAVVVDDIAHSLVRLATCNFATTTTRLTNTLTDEHE